ncbi:hypothetical protein TURU_117607 [Turdus rufiventris]|nr:hypothetical protein TURU_117607 [Turdus rufiventris]
MDDLSLDQDDLHRIMSDVSFLIQALPKPNPPEDADDFGSNAGAVADKGGDLGGAAPQELLTPGEEVKE